MWGTSGVCTQCISWTYGFTLKYNIKRITIYEASGLRRLARVCIARSCYNACSFVYNFNFTVPVATLRGYGPCTLPLAARRTSSPPLAQSPATLRRHGPRRRERHRELPGGGRLAAEEQRVRGVRVLVNTTQVSSLRGGHEQTQLA